MANWFRRFLGPPRAEGKQLEEESPLEDRIRELERWQKDMELTMEEWHGKMRRVLARINRAAKQEDDAGDGEPQVMVRGERVPISVLEAKRRLGIGGGL